MATLTWRLIWCFSMLYIDCSLGYVIKLRESSSKCVFGDIIIALGEEVKITESYSCRCTLSSSDKRNGVECFSVNTPEDLIEINDEGSLHKRYDSPAPPKHTTTATTDAPPPFTTRVPPPPHSTGAPDVPTFVSTTTASPPPPSFHSIG